jgi:hypothetical protein
MMLTNTSVLWIALFVPLLLMASQASADEKPGEHQQGKEMREHGQEGHHHDDHHGKPAQSGMHHDDDKTPMGYKVNPPSLLGGLNAGDQIRFTIDTQNTAIVKIEKLKQ